jgi:hypothetical protein
MSSQTPMNETTQEAAGDVVSRFLRDLHRHDLDALALLLRAEESLDGGPRDASGPQEDAHDGSAAGNDQTARERAARDCAQIVLRSFSGSGLVETERHTSTDGQTVFVEFGRDRPEAARATARRAATRLLRFTTREGAITGITEYAHPFGGDFGHAGRPIAERPGRRAGDGLAWPSLAAVRPADPHAADR